MGFKERDAQSRVSAYKRFSADSGEKQGQEDFALTSVCAAVSGSRNHGIPLFL